MMQWWKQRLALPVVIGVLLTGVTAVFAQETVDPALLAEVTAAFENTRAVDSLHVLSQSVTEGSATAGGLTMNSQQTQEFDIVKTESGIKAQGTITTTLTLPFGEMQIGAETIIVDEVTYIRFNQIPAELPLNLPAEWVEMEAFIAAQSAGQGSSLPGGSGMMAGVSPDDLLAELMLPLTAEAVTAISALPSAEIAGQTMQVYQLTLDSAAVLASDAASLVNTGRAGAGGLPAGTEPGMMALPEGMPEVPGSSEPLSPEDIQLTCAVYIGADGLIYRIYMVVNNMGSGENASSALTVTGVTDYSNFNELVEITAPDIPS